MSNFNWAGDNPDEWYPMDLRFTAVLVPEGETFLGWDHFISVPGEPPEITSVSVDPVASGADRATMQALATDPDGDPLTYSWSMIDGPNGAQPTLETGANATVVFDRAGSYRFQVSVSDGVHNPVTAPTEVVVIEPVAKGLAVSP